MAKKNDKYFRVRNNFHQVLGEYSEKELLSRIQKGKYAGNEEIMELPKGDWQKMASHTRFFDAFVKNIVEAPGDEDSKKSIKLKSESSIHLEKPLTQGQGKTEHIHEIPDLADEKKDIHSESNPAGTLRKSDIDRLFDAPKTPDQLEQPLEELEPPPQEKFKALSQPLNPQKVRALAARFKNVEPRKRRIALLAALLILLILLFKSGNSSEVSESTKVTPTVQNTETQENLSNFDKKESIEALLEESKALYSYDTPLDYKGAADISEEGLRLDSKNTELLTVHALSIARLYQTTRNKEGLLEKLKDTLKFGRQIEPHLSAYYRAETIIALSDGKAEEAARLLQAAKETDPTHEECFSLGAELAILNGDLVTATKEVEQALQFKANSVRAQHIAALVFLRKKNYEQVRKYSGEVAKLNPLHADSYAIVGDAQSEQGDIKNSKILFELTTRLGRFASPETLSHSHSKLATFYGISGNTSEQTKHELASKDSEEGRIAAAEFFHERSYFEDRGKELLKERKSDEAIRFYQALRILYPKDVRTIVQAAEVMEKLASNYEDFRKVMLLYQRAVKVDPNSPEPLVRLASLELGQYNFIKAKELLDRAETLAPDSAEVKVAFGKYYYKRKDYVKSRDYLSKAGTLNPTNAEVYYYYGLLTRLYKPELIKEAARYFYQAYILDVTNYDALAEWLKLKVQEHEKNFSIKFVRNLLETDPKNAELYWVFGEVYASNNEARRAISYYHKALDIDNRSSKVRMSLAKALASVGELPGAVEEFVLASKLDRKNPEGFFEAGQLLVDMKQYDFAEDILKKLINVTPGFPGAYRLLARVYQSKGKKDPSLASMQKEVENNPYNYKYAVEFAELYMSYEEYDKAISELKRVTALPSESKAPEFRVERVRAYLLLSRCLRAQNKSESAEGAIKSAIQIEPADPELKRELGYVYHSLQRDKEATQAFNFYLERNPAAQDADLIKALIKKMGTDEY